MSQKNKLKYEIIADSTKFEKAMQKTLATTKSVSKGIGLAVGAGAVVGTAALAGLTKVMSDAVALANVQEEAETKLAAVLKATGEAAGYNQAQLVAMAGALQSVTTVGDEVTIAGMSILATFKQIKGEAFEGATKAALDMSAVMGQDLKSSVVQIGKALNDPIKGLTALSRVGVSFTDQQREQIKVLQESGDILGAQKIILQELQSEFGGAAEALRGTFKGSVDAAKNAFGDLKEEIGFSITKNEAFIDVAKDAEQLFIKWTKAIKDNHEEIAVFAEGTLTNIKSVVEGIGGAVVAVQKWGSELEKIGNRRTINALREELGELNTDLRVATEGNFLGLGKKSQEEIDKIRRKIVGLNELIEDLETGRDPKSTILGDVDAYNSQIESLVKNIIKVDAATTAYNDTIDDTFSQDQLKKFASAADGIEDVWLDFYKGKQDASDRALEEENSNIEKELSLQEDLTDRLKELSLSETEYKKYQLDKQIADMRLSAGLNKSLQDDVSSYYALKMQEIADSAEAAASTTDEAWKDAMSGIKSSAEDVLSDYLQGEYSSLSDAWSAFCDSMESEFADALAQMVVDWASAELFSDSDSGDSAWDTITSAISNYLSFEDGGQVPVKNYAPGGLIYGGKSTDDIYAGSLSDGTRVMVTGGEYIMPVDKTMQNFGLLEDIRKGKVKGYQTGGYVDDLPWYLMQEHGGYNGYSGSTGLVAAYDEHLDTVTESTEANVDLTEAIEDTEEATTSMADAAWEGVKAYGRAVKDLGTAQKATTALAGAVNATFGLVTAGIFGAYNLASDPNKYYNAPVNTSIDSNPGDSGWDGYSSNQGWDAGNDEGPGAGQGMGDTPDDGVGNGTGPGAGQGMFAKGGVVDALTVPRGWSVPAGDDGYAALSLGEGVIDKDTMQILSSQIRNGGLGGGNITVKVFLNDKELKTTIDDVIVSRNRRGANPKGRAYI